MLPFKGSFLNPSTEDEIVKINKTTNVMDQVIDLMDILVDDLNKFLVKDSLELLRKLDIGN